MDVAIPAAVGALASVVVVLLSALLTARYQRRSAAESEYAVIRGTYLGFVGDFGTLLSASVGPTSRRPTLVFVSSGPLTGPGKGADRRSQRNEVASRRTRSARESSLRSARPSKGHAPSAADPDVLAVVAAVRRHRQRS
jgi:hypothetical protein